MFISSGESNRLDEQKKLLILTAVWYHSSCLMACPNPGAEALIGNW